MFENAAYNAVSPCMNFNTNFIFFLVADITYGVGSNFSIFKFNSIGNLLQMFHCNRSIERNLVNFFHRVAGVCQSFRKIAIVGKQQQSCCISIQPANRVNSFRAGVFYQIHYNLIGMRIVGCGYKIFGFIE